MAFVTLYKNVGIYFNHSTRGYDCDYSHTTSFKTKKDAEEFIDQVQDRHDEKRANHEYNFYFRKNENGTTDILDKNGVLIKNVSTRKFFRGEIDTYENFIWL